MKSYNRSIRQQRVAKHLPKKGTRMTEENATVAPAVEVSAEVSKAPIVSDEVLLRAFLTAARDGGTIADVANATGMKLPSLNSRIGLLRKAGLVLPSLKRRESTRASRVKDTAKLANLFESLKSELANS